MRIPLVRSGGDETPTGWWEWLFAPIVIMVVVVVGGLLAIASVPYFMLYPERHPNDWDRDGNPRHRRALERWRASYARLTLLGRVRRSWIKRRRRRRRAG